MSSFKLLEQRLQTRTYYNFYADFEQAFNHLRGVFKTLSNIHDKAFLQNKLMAKSC